MINNHIKLISLVTYAQSPYASGQVKASGEIILGDDWPIKTDITVKTANDTIESQVSGSLLGTFSANAKITGLNQLNFNGQIDFAKKYAPIRLELSGKQFRWPLTDNAKYHITHFSVSLSGTTNKYALSAKSTISGVDLPQTQFELLSDGTNQAIAFSKLNLAFKQGDFSAKGKMSWDKVFKWDVSTNLNRVDLNEELPNYPIQIQGKVDTTGELSPDKWLINLKKIQLDGNINSKKLFTTGAISIDSQHSIEANNFTVLLGKNQITANGSTLKNGIASQINISSLSSLSDDYSGSINGNINIAGSILKPTIAANLDIANVNWLTTSIKQASIIADITYHDQVSGALSITAKGLEYDHFNFDDVVIQLSGNEKNHTLDVKINGQPESLITHFKGSLDQNHTLWQVESSHVRLQLDNNNTWILDTPLMLSYNLTKNIPSINAHCWKNGASHICVDEAFSYAPKNETTITLTDIDLAKLPIPNNSDTKVAGNFDGKAYISLSKDATPNIKVAINSQAVFIEQHIVSQKLTIPFNLFAINANITPTQADLDWQFSLNEFGNMTGNIQISEPNSKKQLNGHIVIDNLSLSILNPLLQNNEHAKGAINGDLTLSGTLIDPLVTGKIGIESSEIKSNQLPVDIQSGILDINFYGRSSSLKGIINTKAGSIDIDGKANWNTIDKWQSSLSVKGSSLELSVPPMLNVTLVPNIQFEANENTLTLSGSVNIPKGSIVIESLPPSSIDVSNDEVLLDINNPSLGSASSMKIESKLDIIVGDKVSISAFGLNADLRGKLQLQQNNQGLGINGQIAINSGRFNAYGQDLIIRKGNIAFNGLIDRPTLNIEAIRNPEFIENNVTAGIRVNGTTDDAKVEVFADPAMSQQEALSYLLNGHGLDTSANSNDSMTGLLIGLGASQGGKYLGNVGDFFGIKNLSVDTKGSGDTSQVVVSGYLTSDLQLKYGVGLFDSLAQFTVRYRLIPKLYLEAITGTDQVINFLYQFEL